MRSPSLLVMALLALESGQRDLFPGEYKPPPPHFRPEGADETALAKAEAKRQRKLKKASSHAGDNNTER